MSDPGSPHLACCVVHLLREEEVRERQSGPTKGSRRRGFGRLRKVRSGRWSAAYTAPDGRCTEVPLPLQAPAVECECRGDRCADCRFDEH